MQLAVVEHLNIPDAAFRVIHMAWEWINSREMPKHDWSRQRYLEDYVETLRIANEIDQSVRTLPVNDLAQWKEGVTTMNAIYLLRYTLLHQAVYASDEI